MADRFYLQAPPRDGHATLHADEARHLARVRRIGVGQTVEVFDGQGGGYEAIVDALGKDRVELRITGLIEDARHAPVSLTLATAVPKGDRFDWLVEKATELGVDRLVPILCERSTVDPRPAKLDRLRRVVIEASKQCGRFRLMELDPPRPWDELRTEAEGTPRLIAHPGGKSPFDWPAVPPGSRLTVAIGPEGGFTQGEVDRAVSAGWQTAGLGATLLRIETAALAACVLALGRVRTSDTNMMTTGEQGNR